MRPEGNWLLEIGFERIEPPANRTECPSVYKLELPRGRCVVLRGFGVFYGDPDRGGIFLPRYQFQPRCTKHARLDHLPWTKQDLPTLKRRTRSRQQTSAALMSDLIDWIGCYETRVAEQLGVAYRRETLDGWDDGTRPVVPAAGMTSAWHDLSSRIASDSNTLQHRPHPALSASETKLHRV